MAGTLQDLEPGYMCAVDHAQSRHSTIQPRVSHYPGIGHRPSSSPGPAMRSGLPPARRNALDVGDKCVILPRLF
ncbi:hypothetical protein BD779DRAFT_1577763 [Infundibulicybe gibba]|nr:hypothetical protein BD779DRAFT_1577763 [Infundibulicybe gibba]